MDSTTIPHEWISPGGLVKDKDRGPVINLCRPDRRKSCAACCGLYNVTDGTGSSLRSKLERRTGIFAGVQRVPDAIEAFAARVREADAESPLDDAIHVCEFAGLVARSGTLVGCMLHPEAPGNGGVDLRGLCHYGSLACRSFYCPPCEELPRRYGEAVIELVDDWHLYGLVITDADFLIAVFGLVEHRLGRWLDPRLVRLSPARELMLNMLRWKDNWPLQASSSLRRSRYYFKASIGGIGDDPARLMAVLLDALAFTYDVRWDLEDAERMVTDHADRFVEAYRSVW